MHIDQPTLFAVTAFATAVSGLLLLMSWLQDRSSTTLAWWGVGMLLLDVGNSLIVLRGVIPIEVSIIAGNCVQLFAYGLMWSGARSFEGRRPILLLPLAVSATWFTLCQFDFFWTDMPLRIRVSSVLIFSYMMLIASEYLRPRNPELMSRWPTIFLLMLQGGGMLIRLPIAEKLIFPAPANSLTETLVPVGAAALVLFSFALAFLVMAMSKERLGLEHKRDAQIDPLTGAANRRAFFDRGERVLRRLLADGGDAAVLMLDIDKFKRINDTFGHQAGDQVLCAFCDTASRVLRPTDLLGRTGGEEFACLLPGATLAEAFAVAERIRIEFEACRIDLGAVRPTSTVSVGVATTAEVGGSLTALMAAADRALYGAKANGRNRVETIAGVMAVGTPVAPDDDMPARHAAAHGTALPDPAGAAHASRAHASRAHGSPDHARAWPAGAGQTVPPRRNSSVVA
ncbi:MAG: GGDEF domain-containing protein [Rhodoplanes sp.]|uniref:GGDEF domain-containing protein n=1 Tax=Rhodoplanes sp. TaxID=1968906 RepID=UPI0017DF6C81|nr:GGDEF domain-containing protein [Rhodoplanes sp.]NVO13655.1 GGDEF domain-containing protein [Rhodoplanes sp.]